MISHQIYVLLNQGLPGEGDLKPLILHVGAKRLVQGMMEQEFADYPDVSTINVIGQSRSIIRFGGA